MSLRGRRLRSLLLALVAVAGVVLSPVLQALHRAEVHHARCLEHGELIEVVDAREGEAHEDHHEPLALPGDHDQHDAHCAIDHGVLAALGAPHGPLGAGVTPLLLATRWAATSPRGPPLLRYAPKTDPPTCA